MSASLGALLGAVAASVAVGGAHWDALGVPDPCAGQALVRLMPGGELDRLRGGGRRVVADGGGSAAPCRVRVAWDRVYGRSHLCQVIEHELGHVRLLRFPENVADPLHSLDPTSVMERHAGDRVPVECLEAFPPYRLRLLRGEGWRCSPIVTQGQWRCRRRGHYETYVDAI